MGPSCKIKWSTVSRSIKSGTHKTYTFIWRGPTVSSRHQRTNQPPSSIFRHSLWFLSNLSKKIKNQKSKILFYFGFKLWSNFHYYTFFVIHTNKFLNSPKMVLENGLCIDICILLLYLNKFKKKNRKIDYFSIILIDCFSFQNSFHFHNHIFIFKSFSLFL